MIVVGVDTSPGSAAALRWAAAEGRLRSAPVEAVLVWSLLDQHPGPGAPRFDPHYDAATAEATLRDFCAATLGEDSGTNLSLRTVCDLPARGLLDAAAAAELLVVGARGVGGFRGLLLGSVSQQVVHHATCPVVVVRAADANAEG
jgi:nucleotide-binding universal stress UspA family protein